EMAQALYREWFVEFRFPGYEHARFVDSALGRIPEGWEIKKLADTCHLTMGQSPKSEFYNAEGTGLPFYQGVTDFGDRFPTERLYCTADGRIAEAGDILFSVRAPVGRINIANTRMVIGRGLSAIRQRAGCQWFAYHLLKESFQEEDTMGGGTIFKSVTRSDMEGIEFMQPAEALVVRFEHVAQPLENQIDILTRKTITLRHTRDLLLPKLVSGELDVSGLDITVPEEVGASSPR
ncbi:MAG: restriction endonuclease subunit S, partial [Armatimonadetes bacterium]|nr:restriction endonuclease subunit S [Armatimonadota bacterium]